MTNLKNKRLHALEKRKELQRLLVDVARIDSECETYQMQIDAANAEGKSAFDRERYKISKQS